MILGFSLELIEKVWHPPPAKILRILHFKVAVFISKTAVVSIYFQPSAYLSLPHSMEKNPWDFVVQNPKDQRKAGN